MEENTIKKQNDEISIKEIIISSKKFVSYIISKSWIIALSVLIGGSLGYLYASSKKDLYKAELTFVLEEEKSSSGLGLGGLAGQIGLDMGGGSGAFSGDNLLSLMKSRSLVKRTLLRKVIYSNRQMSLAQLYLEVNKDSKWSQKLLNKHVNLEGLKFDKISVIQNTVLNTIYGNLLSDDLFIDKLDKKTSIMLIKVTSPNEFFAKVFTESLAEEVSEFYVNTKTKKSANNVNILQKQVDSVRHELNSAISGVAASLDINPNPNASRLSLKVPSQRKQIDIEANRAILAEMVKNLELSKVTLRKETPLIQVIDSPTYPLALENFGKLKGVILGAVFFGFFSIIIISFNEIIRRIMR